MDAARSLNGYSFTVGMPHLQPYRLSEVELVKVLGDLQWRSLARAAGLEPSQICDQAGRRLYASMVSIELGLPGVRRLEDFDEGTTVQVWNRVGLFGKRLARGFFLFDSEGLEEDRLAGVRGVEELRAAGHPYLSMTNAFVAHGAGGAAAVQTPAAFRDGAPTGLELEEMPEGIREQMRVERSGSIEAPPGEAELRELPARDGPALRYRLVPESDLSGAGVLYCARAVAICNIVERRHLCRRLRRPLSAQAVSLLSTELRQIYYFGSAGPGETLLAEVEVGLLPVPPAPPARWRVPLGLVSRVDLRRASDGVLIVNSRARKLMRIPGSMKGALTEAERFLGALC